MTKTTTETAEIAFEGRTDLGFEETVERCREALAAEGFGVLTEIDVKKTLKAKLDVDREPFLILGACHPPSAHRVLEAVPKAGVLLPCNVTVSVEDGATVVRAMNPGAVMDDLDHPAVRETGEWVGATLAGIVRSVTG